MNILNILEEANQIIHNDRNKDYGTPLQNHSTTAEFWNVYLARLNRPLNSRDVCWLNILQKISRDLHKPKRDNLTDTAGYAGNMEMIDDELNQGINGIDV